MQYKVKCIKDLVRTISYLVLCTFYPVFSYSQNFVKQWDRRFGGTSDEALSSFQQTADGGYILGGTSFSGLNGDKSQASRGDLDFWIVKTDALGYKLWDKRFGGTLEEDLSVVRQTLDGGYILGGFSKSANNGDKSQNSRGGFDYWIVKTDAFGNKLWDKRFGGSGHDYLFDCRQANDKGYILGGFSYSDTIGDKSQPSWGMADYWIVKVDSLGAFQWDQRYGGTNEDQMFSLQQTKDGGYILGGHSASNIGGDKTHATWGGYEDYWLVKISSAGVKQWDKRYGSLASDYFKSIQQTLDGGYIFGGLSQGVSASGDKTKVSHGNYDYWIVKTDVSGNVQWNRSLGGPGTEDGFGNIMQAADGGYLVGSTSYSAPGGDKSELNVGTEQSWIVKMDALGTKVWDKTMLTWGKDEIGLVTETKDGCYAIANSTYAQAGWDKTEPNRDVTNFYRDYWILKLCDTAHASPTVHFYSSDSTLCAEAGMCIDFTDYSGGNPLSWKWYFPGGAPATSADRNPTAICYYTPGTFAVTLVATNANGKDSVTTSKMITVGQTPPLPVLTLKHDTIYCSHASSYQWFASGLAVAGATDSFYVIPGDGTYSVFITDNNGCNRLSNGFVVTHLSEAEGTRITIYPNPVRDELWVEGKGFWVGATTFEIMNILGENIYRTQLTTQNPQPRIKIDVSSLRNGIYFLQIHSEDKTVNTKFVVNR